MYRLVLDTALDYSYLGILKDAQLTLPVHRPAWPLGQADGAGFLHRPGRAPVLARQGRWHKRRLDRPCRRADGHGGGFPPHPVDSAGEARRKGQGALRLVCQGLRPGGLR